jgi:hypothetical protein
VLVRLSHCCNKIPKKQLKVGRSYFGSWSQRFQYVMVGRPGRTVQFTSWWPGNPERKCLCLWALSFFLFYLGPSLWDGSTHTEGGSSTLVNSLWKCLQSPLPQECFTILHPIKVPIKINHTPCN